MVKPVKTISTIIAALGVAAGILYVAARGATSPGPAEVPDRPTPAAEGFHPKAAAAPEVQAERLLRDGVEDFLESKIDQVAGIVKGLKQGALSQEDARMLWASIIPAYPAASSCRIGLGSAVVRTRDLRAAKRTFALWERSIFGGKRADASASRVLDLARPMAGVKPGPEGIKGRWVSVEKADRLVVTVAALCDE